MASLQVKLCMVCAMLVPALAVRSSVGMETNLTAFFENAIEMNWTRAEIVDKLNKAGYASGLRTTGYNQNKDGLLWTGSSWYPGKVFKDGFIKTPDGRYDKDPGESINAWGAAIKDSIAGNSWVYGFHFTVNPRVASVFGVQHVGRRRSAEREGEDECDMWDAECNREILRRFQEKYGCPANDAPVFKEDPTCYDKPCIRLDKLSDPNEGMSQLCPNWGYAYLVKAEGIHVRVPAHAAAGKDYSEEEEVFVPIGAKGNEILGAIPLYARNENGSKRNPGIINFRDQWQHFKKMKVNKAHTKNGKAAMSAIGAFIHNPNYAGGNGPAEVEAELKKKGISNDLGSAIPKYQ